MAKLGSGPPARNFRGLRTNGPLEIQAGSRGLSGVQMNPLRIVDEDGIIQPPMTLSMNYYPTALPAATAGTPTTPMCQILCKQLAALLPQEILQNSTILRLIYRYYYQPVGGTTSGTDLLGNASLPLPQYGNTISITQRGTFSETIPVDVVLSNPALVRDLACRLGSQIANYIDKQLTALYVQFSANAPVGSGNTALTDAVIASACSQIGNSGEPLLLLLHPFNFGLTHGFALGANPFAEAFAWSGMTTGASNLTFNASLAPSTGSAYILPCSQVVRTGAGPFTNQNLMFTPSAMVAMFGLDRDVSVLTNLGAVNAQSGSVFQNVAATVFCANTGSGTQTIYASSVFGVGVGNNNKGNRVLS